MAYDPLQLSALSSQGPFAKPKEEEAQRAAGLDPTLLMGLGNLWQLPGFPQYSVPQLQLAALAGGAGGGDLGLEQPRGGTGALGEFLGGLRTAKDVVSTGRTLGSLGSKLYNALFGGGGLGPLTGAEWTNIVQGLGSSAGILPGTEAWSMTIPGFEGLGPVAVSDIGDILATQGLLGASPAATAGGAAAGTGLLGANVGAGLTPAAVEAMTGLSAGAGTGMTVGGGAAAGAAPAAAWAGPLGVGAFIIMNTINGLMNADAERKAQSAAKWRINQYFQQRPDEWAVMKQNISGQIPQWNEWQPAGGGMGTSYQDTAAGMPDVLSWLENTGLAGGNLNRYLGGLSPYGSSALLDLAGELGLPEFGPWAQARMGAWGRIPAGTGTYDTGR